MLGTLYLSTHVHYRVIIAVLPPFQNDGVAIFAGDLETLGDVSTSRGVNPVITRLLKARAINLTAVTHGWVLRCGIYVVQVSYFLTLRMLRISVRPNRGGGGSNLHF